MQKAKARPIKRKKDIEVPKLSILHSKKLRTIVPTIIAGLIMIALGFVYPPIVEDSSIQTSVIVFGALTMIVPLTLVHLKESQRKEKIDKKKNP